MKERITKTTVREAVDRLNELTGRNYHLYAAYGYYGLDLLQTGGSCVVREYVHGSTLREVYTFIDGMLTALESIGQ